MSSESSVSTRRFKAVGFWVLVVFAAAITALASIFAVSGVGLIGTASRASLWLLGFNFALVLILGVAVFLRFSAIRREQTREGGGRLARRFVTLFSISAILPAMIVAVFLSVTITRGLDAWFSDRVRTVVEEAALNAQSTIDTIAEDIRDRTVLMGSDLNNAVDGLRSEPDTYAYYLGAQASIREFTDVYVLNASGRILSLSPESDQSVFIPPSPSRFLIADEGDVAVRLFEEKMAFTALSGLPPIRTLTSMLPVQLVRARLKAFKQPNARFRTIGKRKPGAERCR